MKPETKNQRFGELLGSEIRSRRESLQRSLDDVARDSESGISKSSLSLMETGLQQISARQLFELSRILNFSVDDFLGRVEKNLNAEEYSDLNKHL
ncbi:MAG: helix-turn-helix domain-containing protein [Patescibacteria group bacterium]